MAGDWIKMKSALANEPEVRAIAKRTGLDLFAVVGRLHAVWAYADSVTECGEIPYLDEGDIDKMVEHEGFADAMRQVGWLEVRDASIVIPAFETHNGKSAKRRSQTAKRNSEWRKKPDSKGTKRKRDASSVTSASPREEKRREEKNTHSAREPFAPQANRLIPFEGQELKATDAADLIAKRSKWPASNVDRAGLQQIMVILGEMADGAMGPDAQADPVTTLGKSMNAYARTRLDADNPERFTKILSNWLKEQYPDLLAGSGVPHVANR
jgi:hypothetical protein